MKTLLTLLLVVAVASPASAVPLLRYTWGPADGMVTNQDWAGPATYTQTLSVTGLSGSVGQVQIVITYGPYRGLQGPGFEHAWNLAFSPADDGVPRSLPRNDCRGVPAFFAGTGVAGASATPGATLSARVVSMPLGITRPEVVSQLLLDLTFDPPLQADPATRYGLATLEYHLQNAMLGYGDETKCEWAEQPMCWLGTFATAGGQSLVWEAAEFLTWQDADGTTNCWYAVTPARASSWGSIKQIYR